MKKFVNDVEQMLRESLQRTGRGAQRPAARCIWSPPSSARKQLSQGKVALISGGGSGHEPLHCGLHRHRHAGRGLPGQVFTSPTPDQMLAAATAVDRGEGVLFIVKNYAGDVMNFQMAAEMMRAAVTPPCWSTTTWRSSARPTARAGAAWPAR